jgi:hypothetical protein
VLLCRQSTAAFYRPCGRRAETLGHAILASYRPSV